MPNEKNVADAEATTSGGGGKEAAPNKKADADAGAFDSAPLLGSYITEEEGSDPKENLLAAVAAPAEAITTGIVSADALK